MKKNDADLNRRLLRGTGIIMIIFGVMETLLFVLLLTALLIMKTAIVDLFSGKREIVSAALFLGAGLTELAAGILGCRFAKRGNGRTACLAGGLLCLAVTVASLILLGREADLLWLVTILLCAVLPSVYIISVLRCEPIQQTAIDREIVKGDS